MWQHWASYYLPRCSVCSVAYLLCVRDMQLCVCPINTSLLCKPHDRSRHSCIYKDLMHVLLFVCFYLLIHYHICVKCTENFGCHYNVCFTSSLLCLCTQFFVGTRSCVWKTCWIRQFQIWLGWQCWSSVLVSMLHITFYSHKLIGNGSVVMVWTGSPLSSNMCLWFTANQSLACSSACINH